MRRVAVMLLIAGSIPAACSRRQPPPPPTPTPTETPTPPPQQPPPARPTVDPAAEARAATERARTALQQMVFFDYDQSAIRPDAQQTLSQKVAVLRANPNVTLRIAGHADERGSIEYNLALGQRRAQAVREYLAGFNLDANRFTIESFGEERPLDPGTTEAAYARNRRAEFTITAGGESMVFPGGS